MSAKKRTLAQFVAEQKEADPVFAAEFDRLRLARRIRTLRERRNVSQVELAAMIGTKQPNIARLESGRVTPRIDLLFRVARALATPLGKLVGP
jgi:ribosome-binding protein aMBF1 (putative translation factor)